VQAGRLAFLLAVPLLCHAAQIVLRQAVSLLLAAIGCCGVTARVVAQRTNEIGIRMALGGDRGNLINLVLPSALARVAVELIRCLPGDGRRAVAGRAVVRRVVLGSGGAPRRPSDVNPAHARPPIVYTLRIKVLRDSVQSMSTDQVHRTSRIVLIVLSLTALLTVLFGYTQAPLPDEGTGAHIFQLAVVAGALTTVLFLGTADWTQPSRAVRQLAVPAAAFVLAFAALYYLENHYYPAHYP
jgi:hypothetical protein